MYAGGVLSVVLPCEGGFAYTLGRRLTTQRVFEKRYGMSFDWCIKSEHVSIVPEIVEELDRASGESIARGSRRGLPTVHTNVCVGLTYRRD